VLRDQGDSEMKNLKCKIQMAKWRSVSAILTFSFSIFQFTFPASLPVAARGRLRAELRRLLI
jgi:hypothetical protein